MGTRGPGSGMSGTSNDERKRERQEKNGEYETWDDVPVEGEEGGWRYDPRYEEHGEAQTEFFNKNSNYDALINGMSMDERSAFKDDWTAGTFMGGQQYGGWDNMSSSHKRLTQIYDDILDRATLNKGIVVARMATAELVLGKGNTRGSLEALQKMKGQVVVSRGNMSCGAAKQGLHISSADMSNKNVEYRIHIPAGQGAGMWIGDHRINHWGTIQREFMTNRDSRFRVGNTKYDKKRGVYVVDLTYDGHLSHDYGTSGRIPTASSSYVPWRRSTRT